MAASSSGGSQTQGQLSVDDQHQCQQPEPHGGSRQQNAGGQQPLQPSLLLVEAGKLQVRAVEEASPASMLVSTSPERVPSRRTAK